MCNFGKNNTSHSVELLSRNSKTASELTLVPRQHVPNLKPSEVRNVLILVRYVQNPQMVVEMLVNLVNY
jgi:hypothetical protein